MHKVKVIILVLVVSTSIVAADGSVVLRCGRMIDAVSASPIVNASILVRDGHIESVGQGITTPTGVEEILLGTKTCLPGLIDLHAHLTINPETLSFIDVKRSSAARALDALRNAQTMLRSGFTTLRCPGEFDRFYSVVDVRDAINRGEFVGPRILVAPHPISATGGHGDFNNLASDLAIETPTRIVDGADSLRKAIREEFKHGADWIKLMVTGGIMSAGDDPNVTTFSDEELPYTHMVAMASKRRSVLVWIRSSTVALLTTKELIFSGNGVRCSFLRFTSLTMSLKRERRLVLLLRALGRERRFKRKENCVLQKLLPEVLKLLLGRTQSFHTSMQHVSLLFLSG